MKILLLEPYFQGSHKQWAEELQRQSSHHIEIVSMPGRFWKWRMHGAAITLAKEFNAIRDLYELILTTDMMDLALFKSLAHKKNHKAPIALYFHENQLSYPKSSRDTDSLNKRDNHYAFINYSSALAADQVFFNSHYHYQSFFERLETFLMQFPDYKNLDSIAEIEEKSFVLPVAIDGQLLLKKKKDYEIIPGLILWNHRWEYDKNPDAFFHTLIRLKNENVPFQLVVLGNSGHQYPEIFKKAKEVLADRIIHFGYVENRDKYIEWLWKSHIIPVTSNQDFFGISAVEAMYCHTIPLLPNRLAFPEHLEHEYFSSLYYNTDEELYVKLKEMLLHGSDFKTQEIQNQLKKYDWYYCKYLYDSVLENVKLKR